jgi:pyruvate-formate lyase
MKTFDALYNSVKAARPVDEATKELIFTLSKIIDEERTFQAVVDKEGAIYTTTGDKGQTYIKTRPEYDQLQKLRDKKRAYVKAIGIAEAESFDEDFS